MLLLESLVPPCSMITACIRTILVQKKSDEKRLKDRGSNKAVFGTADGPAPSSGLSGQGGRSASGGRTVRRRFPDLQNRLSVEVGIRHF